jgi:hypothetical protein
MLKVPTLFSRCDWVFPIKLPAGRCPGAKTPEEAAAKLTALIKSGIRHVINPMQPDETDLSGHRLVPYADLMAPIALKLRVSVTFDQLPIKYLSVPTERHMARVLNQIDLCINHEKPVDVHCLGGIGRTGTVVGRYLVRHILATGKNALDMIMELRKDSEDIGREPPGTREQRLLVVGWQERIRGPL